MSKICSFLGNAQIWVPDGIPEKLKSTIIRLITDEQVDTFYVGTKGDFELLAHKTVAQIQRDYPNIRIWLIIAYVEDLHNCCYSFNEFFYPPMSELGHRRWSISERNEWIIKYTDYIIAYNQYEGRAYKFCQKAKRKGKTIIEIGKKSIETDCN